MKKLFVILLFIIGFFFLGSLKISYVYASSGDPAETSSSFDDSFDISNFRNNNYYRVLQAWKETYSVISKTETVIPLADFTADNPGLNFTTVSDYPGQSVTTLNENQSLQITINVPETGLYELGMDFKAADEFYTIPTISILVNGESQYNELDELELEVLWQIQPLAEDVRYNRYGNELLPGSKSVLTWSKYYFDDYNSSVLEPYKFLLEAGENTITITSQNLSLIIGSFYLKGEDATVDYNEYIDSQTATNQTQSKLITIQGESFIYKNDLEVKSSYYKESAMTPYSYKHTILNQLDGASMSRAGTKVTYEFDVEEAGYYNIALKVLKNSNFGVSAAKNIYIDGQIPFEELAGYLFSSNRKWQNVSLGNDDGLYSIYLEAGIHTLSIESTSFPYTAYINELNLIMDEISSISLMVQTITGGNPNDTVDWDILKYIPDLVERLEHDADRLEAIYDEIDALDPGSDNAGEVSTLNVAAKQLRMLAKTPNKLGSKLTEFSEGSGSAYQLIGNGISYLISQPLSVDCIYFYNDMELPKPTGSFLRKVWDGIRSFFYSFFDARYNNSDVDADTLEVWVGQSSLYLDIIQSMIDQGFTEDTGIKVKCSILADVSKIVLSNATGDNPDAVLSIDSWNPYAYALRGMLTDLSKLDGFDEITSHIYANNFTPVIFEDGVYAIPETQSVYLMYYRRDIFDYLELDAPDTWNDVIDILPILQSHQMNFYHPLGGNVAYKGYGLVAPIIYQFGGEIYTEDGYHTTLTDQNTINAIEFMTDLFNVYDMPLQVSSFFEHFRSGDMPIGISTIDLYLQMKYAAPELSGQWDVTVLPGYDRTGTGEVERWSTTYGKSSILFANSDKQEEAWELIKWWNSTQTQIQYMQNIKTSLGEKYLLLSANMDALKQSVWNEDIKDVIIDQARWARIPAVTPGSYMVERELSNIWNKVVIDKDNVLIAINESIPRVLRELSRKADEFGYESLNNPDGLPYIVPMNSNITIWIEEGYDET